MRAGVACLALTLAIAAQRSSGSAQAPLASPPPPAITASASPAPSPVPVVTPAAYDAFLKDAKRSPGLIDVLDKDGDIYFDLRATDFGPVFIVAPAIARGEGDAFSGRFYAPFALRFERVGKRVLWLGPDPRSRNGREGVLASTAILADSEAKAHTIVSAAYFLTDVLGIGRTIARPQPGPFGFPIAPAYALDLSKSAIARVRSRPAQLDLLAELAFTVPPAAVQSGPQTSLRIGVTYTIVRRPAAGTYVPRVADDRVGYFETLRANEDDDADASPHVRYIDRFDLARGPIVYVLDPAIPAPYRGVVRSAILEWNRAFAAIGMPHAIDVEDAPHDPRWNPDDDPRNVVRWISSVHADFSAYGPFVADPYTGRILRAEVVIDGEALRAVRSGDLDAVFAPGRNHATFDEQLRSAELDDAAVVGERSAGALDVDAFVDGWLRQTVMHEVGHNLGLTHNFAASGLYTYRQVRDARFVAAHGISASVMDYLPVDFVGAAGRERPAFQATLGPYDFWAIRYGYGRFGGQAATRRNLAAIAAEGSRPEFRYGDDADASTDAGIDPTIAPFDLSSDPLAFDAFEIRRSDRAIADLDRTYPRDGRSFAREREALVAVLALRERSLLLAARYVGGALTSRAPRAPGARAPLRPIPARDARRAFELIAERAFGPHAFDFPPQLLADVATPATVGGDDASLAVPGFPASAVVAAAQDRLTFDFFAAPTMARLVDLGFAAPRGEPTMSLADLFAGMQTAVFADVDEARSAQAAAFGDALQARYANLLTAFALASPALLARLGYPAASSGLARYELAALLPRLRRAAGDEHLDTSDRAAAAALAARIAHVLDARAIQP